MNKLNVAIVMGGYSGESVISLKSGEYFLSQINKEKYNVYGVHILKEGWNAVIENQKFSINKADFSFALNEEKIKFDVVVNTIHGTPGEDGLMQAYWKLLGIAHTGCSFYNSALTFNKRDTLSVLKKYDIPMAESVYINQGDKITPDSIFEKVGLPCFVKPNQSGSSLGVTKVKTKEEFLPALEFAFKEGKEVLVESFLKGREISVGVMKYEGKTKVVGITELIPVNEFFDYEAKYNGSTQEVTPAQLDTEIQKKVEKLAAYIYEVLGMTGFSRTDFIIVDGIPNFIEMNTNPGCSQASIFPQQVKHAGLIFSDLINSEIQLALQNK